MTKKELRTFVKDQFKSQGFCAQKSYLYKILDDDYLIGFHLYPSTYCKGYEFICGVIYLPDELKMPLCGRFDLEWIFRFPVDPTYKLNLSSYQYNQELTTIFEYEKYSAEQLEEYFIMNYKQFIIPLYNKEFGLELLRQDWRLMNRFSVQTVDKLCKRASLDTQTVLKRLGKSIS